MTGTGGAAPREELQGAAASGYVWDPLPADTGTRHSSGRRSRARDALCRRTRFASEKGAGTTRNKALRGSVGLHLAQSQNGCPGTRRADRSAARPKQPLCAQQREKSLYKAEKPSRDNYLVPR